jgi:serine/threonine protein kinase
MELCKETLSDYLNKRQNQINKKKINTIIDNKTQILSKEKIIESIKIFHSIVKALVDIHKEGLIHRDLKPGNIFICKDGGIKIGDFGLVTKLINEGSSDESNSNKKKSFKSLNKIQYTITKKDKKMLTKNVGTLIYASPEQLLNNFYDQKTDIFSLGLIFFELVYPMKTQMEKNKLFNDIKQFKKLPKQLLENYQISQILLKMVCENPKNRPTSDELLIYIENELINTKKIKTNLELCNSAEFENKDLDKIFISPINNQRK